MKRLRWLAPDDPPDAFPPVETALDEPDGLLAGGGDLSPERLLAAYSRGIFPWFSPGQPVLWWSPDPREVLVPADFHRSRSLERTLRRRQYTVTMDRAFGDVIAACAAPRRQDHGTWITAGMQAAYGELHARGHAHSIEVWDGDRLVGGTYGVRVRRVFCGESMFSREPDASKVALSWLAGHCPRLGIELIDCQLESPHLRSLGSRPMARADFIQLIRLA